MTAANPAPPHTSSPSSRSPANESPPAHAASASTTRTLGPLTELRDLWTATRVASHRIPRDVTGTIAVCSEAEGLIAEAMGRPIKGCKAVEIGPGQVRSQMNYFATRCDVVGIDLDVIPTTWDVPGYVSMARRNGVRRVIKTIGRRMLGGDSTYLNEFRRQMGIPAIPKTRVLWMDASKMSFPEGSIDFIYSFSVFEHIPDPAAVWRECARVLKPGGCIYSHFHLYTCDSGNHDPRIVSGARQDLPYWPHLRPASQGMVRTNAYLNKKRLGEWWGILDATLPGGKLVYQRDDDLALRLAEARRAGDLADYSDDELLTHNIISVWRKP